jgi:hypothetical protein
MGTGGRFCGITSLILRGTWCGIGRGFGGSRGINLDYVMIYGDIFELEMKMILD